MRGQQSDPEKPLYIVLVSVHGLIRGQELELGRDADTGGQTKYVVELARALSHHPRVGRVDLLTRQVPDGRVDPQYAEPLEPLSDSAFIVRLPFGPRRYLRKEVLWPHLDSMADQALKHIRAVGRVPDVIHSHYADAGYVGSRLACLLGVPLIHTGHSLGREKLRRLKEHGIESEAIEKHYNINRRIEAEEAAMDNASLVIASTHQEVEQQYSLYDNYHPKRMLVIPPGVDVHRFRPPKGLIGGRLIRDELARFLTNPHKPMILALARADERKNFSTLVRAFGENPQLRETANLVVVAGNRDDISEMDKGARKVLSELLLLIDRHDLYGSVAFPKHHRAEDVPELFRLAARSRGVFVNPALTEPFGLTLIEAAASGLPMVATEDGGPRDILGHCNNGILVNPSDAKAVGEALLDALTNHHRWKNWSRNGLRGVNRHYTWPSHVESYLKAVGRVINRVPRDKTTRVTRNRLPTVERILFSDIDRTLLNSAEATGRLMALLKNADPIGLGIATGRSLPSAVKIMKENRIDPPDVLITSVGTEIYYGARTAPDKGWEQHIAYRWERERLVEALRNLPGLRFQPSEAQRAFKISCFVEPQKAPIIRRLVRYLRGLDLHANAIYSHQAYLDLVPIRASKGQAIRFLGSKWGISPEAMLVAGNSGNDVEMLRGDTLGVVVGDYSPELEPLRGEPRIYFAHAPGADGVLEGIHHYGFLEAGSEQWNDEELLQGSMNACV